jgi:aspartate racemase
MREQAVIGLIGGMSWESSAEYYRIINREVRNRLGGVHSARSLMWSVDFGEIECLQHQGDWDELTNRMKDAAIRLQRGGADFVLLCTNTMHLMADAVADAIDIPLLHIADPTAEKIKAAGFEKVGLLGTAFTMEQDFYKGRLERVFGLDVLVPDADDRRVVHEVHLQGTGRRRDSYRIADGLSRGHRTAGGKRRPGDYPRLHRDHAAGLGGGQRGALVRYHHDPRHCRGGPRPGPNAPCRDARQPMSQFSGQIA